MSHYLMKSDGKRKEYVVIKHGIPGVNSSIMGVKFRGGYAVVEKGGKLYHRLRKLPMLKDPEERPLEFLAKLPFITRTADIKLIYGADVYSNYVRQLSEVKTEADKQRLAEEEAAHLADPTKCKFRLDTGRLCKHPVKDPKISQYCPTHILKDPKLQEVDFKVPLAMDPEERAKVRTKAFNRLRNLMKLSKSENIDDQVAEEQTEEPAIIQDEDTQGAD